MFWRENEMNARRAWPMRIILVVMMVLAMTTAAWAAASELSGRG